MRDHHAARQREMQEKRERINGAGSQCRQR
jgi:hypothetical protein